MSNYYSHGQLAQYEETMDRQEVIDSFINGIDYVNAEEEHYQDWIYRFDCTIACAPNGGKSLFSVSPIFVDD